MSGNDPGPWPWVQRSIVLVIHDRQLAEHGGSDGIRDPEAIESTVSTLTSWTRYGPWRERREGESTRPSLPLGSGGISGIK